MQPIRKLNKQKLVRLQEDYEQGMGSQTNIAKRFGISRARLWQIAREFDWEFGGKRQADLKRFSEISSARLNAQRMEAVESHALELQQYREDLDSIKSIDEAVLLEKKVHILEKLIKSERTAFGLPNEIRQLESRQDVNIRVEDMLKTLEAKKKEITYEVLPESLGWIDNKLEKHEADIREGLLTNEQNGAEVCESPV
ncbi:uncharacterized protein METZ01_LOCUS115124 [marine metagenome]|uniref:Uncharacterized protein n=1 Tax=marine metagenome TaxID=408172 RepID=A0A381XCG0_9ZZZZ|tara:strand:+ start:296 stop:889 length:594 start_codon:yes stop_codon:yes gene_type:complete